MDKYEFNLRIDQIKKKIASEDFETAMKIADTIDWRRVRNINILSMVSGRISGSKGYSPSGF